MPSEVWEETGAVATRCNIVTRFLTNFWLLAKDAAARWVNHKDARQGAALAYYSVFSLGPVLVIAVAIAGFIFGQDAARGEVEVQLKSLLGRTAAKAVDAMLAGASAPKQRLVATVVGTVILLFTARLPRSSCC